MISAMCGPADFAFWFAFGLYVFLSIVNAILLLLIANVRRETRKALRNVGDPLPGIRVVYVDRFPKERQEELRRLKNERNYWRDLWKEAKREPQLPSSLTDCLKDPNRT